MTQIIVFGHGFFAMGLPYGNTDATGDGTDFSGAAAAHVGDGRMLSQW